MLQERRYALCRHLQSVQNDAERNRIERTIKILWHLQIRAAASALKQRYQSNPFYADRAANSWRYWRDLASSEVIA
jgi:hypothetical protein